MFIFGVHKNPYHLFVKPFIISIILIVVTFSLGVWQLKRLEWKNEIISNFNNLKISPAIDIDFVKIKEFTKIKATGTINRNKKIFFPAKTYNGKAGMILASEFTTINGKKYLLDEGWFKNSRYSYFLNNSEKIKVNIEGYIRFPRKPKIFTPKNNIIKNQWYTYDLIDIGNFLSSPLNQSFFIKKVSLNKENFLISSSLKHNFANNHLQYAITWFLMSFSFIILFLVYLKKIK